MWSTRSTGITVKMVRTVTLFLLSFLVTFPPLSWADPANFNEDDVARLDRGEILLQTIHTDLTGGAARVTALFHTDTDTIWNIIGYCKYEYVYVRGLQSCEVVLPGLVVNQKRHRIRNSWYTPAMDFTFEARRTSPTHGEFHLIGGDLEVMEGQWNLQPQAGSDSVIVVHEIRIKSRLPSPRWLVRHVLIKDLPDMLACIRGLAKASGDDSRILADLARCPGDIATVNN